MASPASFNRGKSIPLMPGNPGSGGPEYKIQPVMPNKKPKLTKAAKYRGIKETKEVNKIYNTY